MIYLENDFYSNFNSMVDSNDELSLKGMFIDQISNLIAYKKSDLVDLFGKIGIKVSKKPTNKELSNIIATNLKGNKKLQIGLAYLIAEDNNILQQEMKKSRPNDDGLDSFDGTNPKTDKKTDKTDKTEKTPKPKKPIDWNKTADAVTSIAGSISVLSDSITQNKTGQFADELNNQSNVKSPEQIAKEEEDKKLAEAKAKRTRRTIVIGVVVIALGVTAFIGYKKGWFGKGQVNPN
jgi:hypothetical protein